MDPLAFTPENPCRCGFDGSGKHRCHARRHQSSEEHCTNEAVPQLVAQLACLAGTQMKTGVAIACYCPSCHAAAFPRSRQP